MSEQLTGDAEREGNPAFMSDEECRKEWGEVCSFCGYREAHHPREYADPDKDGYLCEEADIDG
jgi:hypothetical protein